MAEFFGFRRANREKIGNRNKVAERTGNLKLIRGDYIPTVILFVFSWILDRKSAKNIQYL
jgi:hypothetical protein